MLLNTMTFHGDLPYTTKQFRTNLTDVTLINFERPYWKTLYTIYIYIYIYLLCKQIQDYLQIVISLAFKNR